MTTALLAEAGSILLGKLSTWEFAIGGTSFDLPWPPRRTRGTSRMIGGSSSGSGAAMARASPWARWARTRAAPSAARPRGAALRSEADLRLCEPARHSPAFVQPRPWRPDVLDQRGLRADDGCDSPSTTRSTRERGCFKADFAASVTKDVKGLKIGVVRTSSRGCRDRPGDQGGHRGPLW